MSRKKQLFAMFVALILVCSLLMACKPDDVITKTLQSISLNTENAKLEFFVGEDYSAEGLVVIAEFKSSDSNEIERVTLTSGQFKADASAYNKNVVGEYQIRVSYEFEGTTKAVLYRVKVIAVSFDGLCVEFAEGTQDTFYLSTEITSVEIDTGVVVVKEVDIDGNEIDNVISDYTVELYRGTQKVELTEGKAVVGEGAYQIWVSKKSDKVVDYIRKAFVTIYVIDNLVGLSWDNTAEGTNTEQGRGEDVISATWKFVATYESGATKVITSDVVNFEKAIDTATTGNKTVNVTYTESNAKGESHTSTAIEVTYTITAATSGEPIVVTVNISDLETTTFKSETQLAPGILVVATSEKTIAIDTNDKEIDGFVFTKRLKLGGLGSTTERSLKFVVDGPATVVLYAITSSSGDLTRTLSLYDESGTLVPGSTTDGIPNAVTKFVFEIPEAGTYYILGSNSINIYYISVTC